MFKIINQKTMKKLIPIILIILFLTGCGKTPEQIVATQKLEQQRFEQNQKATQARRKFEIELEKAKSPEVKAAEITAKEIRSAKNTYMGIEAAKWLLK